MRAKRISNLRYGIFFQLLLLAAQPGHAQNPVPLISQPLVPAVALPGGAPFTLTVNGSGFVSGSVVNWNTSALVTTFVSSDKLTAVVPATEIATAGTAWVTVSSGGVISNVAYFEVTSPITSVSFNNTFTFLGPITNPSSIAVGDFNGDGKLDVAVATSSGATVMLGKGDGTFQTPVSWGGGDGPIAVGDFNGDGKLDLVIASKTFNNVSLLLGNGDGTFQPPVVFLINILPSSVAVGDFNGDGKLDVAATDLNSNTVKLMLGNGDGTFTTFLVYAVGSLPTSVAVGDLNGDGNLDLSVVNQNSGTVSVLLGNGDGTFQPAVNYAVGILPTSVAVGDFNGDGRLDLAVVGSGAGVALATVSILLGNGNGTFQPAVKYLAGNQLISVAVGDLNGDGKLDLVVAVANSPSVNVLLGNGDGTFQTAAFYTVGMNPLSVAVGDLDGDGKADLAVANSGSNNISILLQRAPTVQLNGGNTFTGNQTVNGTVTATGFVGDGSGLTGVNAATVANGVYTTGSYADPSWITSLSGSKITGSVLSAATALTANTAGALAFAPSQCGASMFSTGIMANGNANCLQPASANLSDGSSLVLNSQANTFTGGKQVLPASTISYASINLPNSGVTPTSPVVGDIWLSSADVHVMFVDKNNATQSLAFLTDVTSGDAKLFGADNNFTGSNSFGKTITGSITGNAGTVTNGVYSTNSYVDPSWITSLSGSKITGTVTSATTAGSALTAGTATLAGNVTGVVAVTNGGTGVSTAGANTYFAGPISGPAAPPTFRALTPSDTHAVLNIDATTVAVSNTATETTVYSFSIPGGTLSSNGSAIRVNLVGSYQNDVAPGDGFNVRVYYGSTILWGDFAPTLKALAAGRLGGVRFEFLLFNAGSPGAQELGGVASFSGIPHSPSSAGKGSFEVPLEAEVLGSGSVDATANQTFRITIQPNAANAGLAFTKNAAVMEQVH